MYRRMSEHGFDCAVTDAVIGRLDGRRLAEIVLSYGIPDPQQWAALKEIIGFDERIKARRPVATRNLATSI